MSRLEISRAGLDLIESFEGFRAKAARLPNGNYTIGFGHTMTARDGMVVNRDQAEELLKWDLGPIQDFVRQNALTNLTQNQFDALASFVFNIGIENFKTSDVLRHLNQGEPISAAIAMSAWRRAHLNGKPIVVDALVRRRSMEAALFLDTIGPRPAAPSPIIVPHLDQNAAILAPKPENIKAINFEKSSEAKIPADVNVQAATVETPVEKIGDTIITTTEKDAIVEKLLTEEKDDLGGQVLKFPSNEIEETIVETSPNLAANAAPTEDVPPANDSVNKVRAVPAAIAAAAASATIAKAPLEKTAKNFNQLDPFTIFVTVIGAVAFAAGLYEAIGQGMFKNGLSGIVANPSNIFVLLTMVIGAVTATFGLFSLFFEEADTQ